MSEGALPCPDSSPRPPGSPLAEFGPLIVFWALAATLGVKPAILGSILFILGDAAWRWRGASRSPASICW